MAYNTLALLQLLQQLYAVPVATLRTLTPTEADTNSSTLVGYAQ
jgi:hypothetical protein